MIELVNAIRAGSGSQVKQAALRQQEQVRGSKAGIASTGQVRRFRNDGWRRLHATRRAGC